MTFNDKNSFYKIDFYYIYRSHFISLIKEAEKVTIKNSKSQKVIILKNFNLLNNRSFNIYKNKLKNKFDKILKSWQYTGVVNRQGKRKVKNKFDF